MEKSKFLDLSFESPIVTLSPLAPIQADILYAFDIYEGNQTRPTWVKKPSKKNSSYVNRGIVSAIQSKRRFESKLPRQVFDSSIGPQVTLSSSLVFSVANLIYRDASRPLFFKQSRTRLSSDQSVARIKRQMNFAAKYAQKNWSRGLDGLTFRVTREDCFWVYFYYLCLWIEQEYPALSQAFKDTFQSPMLSIAGPR